MLNYILTYVFVVTFVVINKNCFDENSIKSLLYFHSIFVWLNIPQIQILCNMNILKNIFLCIFTYLGYIFMITILR